MLRRIGQLTTTDNDRDTPGLTCGTGQIEKGS